MRRYEGRVPSRESARTVLLALGIRSVALAGDVEAGIPPGFVEGARRLPVVVKAGGFRDPDTLVRLYDLLTTTSERLPRPHSDVAGLDVPIRMLTSPEDLRPAPASRRCSG
ncbi:hypothetical protein [Nonomuraea sp. NPDC049400]|uniref:hypothetical protein n=1 Tax=Nonomuraea sp. NPDC049400 TaxID=3364352 RepID=UPI00379B459A